MARRLTVAVRALHPGFARAPERGRGFTLLEILVVVLIIGIVLSLATLAFRDNIDERMKTEAQRLAALLTLAGQEAMLQSKEMAVLFTAQEYRFQVLEENKWIDSKDPMFRERQLAEDISLFLEIEGETAQLVQEESEDPHVYLLSSGEMTPFVLTLKHKNSTATYQLRGDFGGVFTLGP